MKIRRGIQRADRSGLSRVASFVSALTRALVVAAIAAAVLFLVQAVWHPFDSYIDLADRNIARVDATLNSGTVAGISLGTIVLIAAIVGMTLSGKGVHKKQYLVSFWRGILSSSIFLLSDTFYRFVRMRGRLYYSAALFLFIAAIFVLVELMARWGRQTEERERRTEYLASIVSGLCFALIVQAGERALAFIRERADFLG